jgi:hypothetical protein
MKLMATDFRISRSAQRRWDDYPDIDEMILKAYQFMQMSAKQDMTLNPALLQDLNHSVLSDASSKYPIRVISSIVNKLRADHKDFVAYLESTFRLDQGYDFFSARLDIDYLEDLNNYASIFNSLSPDEIGRLILSVDSADLHKDNRSYFYAIARETIFKKEEKGSLSTFLHFGINNYPHIFSGVMKHEVYQLPNLRDVVIDFLFDESLEINKEQSLLLHKCLDFMSPIFSKFIFDRINNNSDLNDSEKVALLINVIENRLGSTFDDALTYLEDEILINPVELKNNFTWALQIACNFVLSRHEHWQNYSLAEAAIIYNGTENAEYSVKSFINALERESILTEAESLSIIDLKCSTKSEVSKLYYPAFKFILENAKQKSVRNYSIDTQHRIFEYAFATDTDESCKHAFYKAYDDVLSSITNDFFKPMVQEFFIAARDKFGLSIEPLSSSNKRMLLDAELAI